MLAEGNHPPFEQTLAQSGLSPLRAPASRCLQVNVGKLCNQTCRHCHVDAGPERREVMSRETMALCLDVLARAGVPTLDVTGGAPEMNPHFRWLVAEARALGRHVIDRCNLTILLAPGFDDLPEFLAERRVEVVASLPCYLPQNTDAQRGEGVFEKSITALRRLNAVGYGRPDSGLVLTLVYNPVGPSLPPPQPGLEAAYRRELASRYGVVFNRLFTITNMPISRFLDDLVRAGPRGGVHGEADRRLQPGGGGRRHVPDDALGRLGRPAVRLRFQPDAGAGPVARPAAAHPRLRPGQARPAGASSPARTATAAPPAAGRAARGPSSSPPLEGVDPDAGGVFVDVVFAEQIGQGRMNRVAPASGERQRRHGQARRRGHGREQQATWFSTWA